METQKGQSLAELVVVLAIIGLALGATATTAGSARKRIALAAATSELRAVFMSTRALAVAHDRNVAIRFQPSGSQWSWTIYEDGDRDGVRNDDITRGVDRLIEKPRLFQHAPVRIGVPGAPIPDPTAPGKTLGLRLPVRFGTSLLCSFSRNGEATNGSVVLTDGRGATVIRVGGTSARINVLRWNGKAWITGV